MTHETMFPQSQGAERVKRHASLFYIKGDFMIFVVKIVNTHGVRGEVKALHYTDGEVFFKKVKTLYTKEGTPIKILNWRFQKGAVLLTLDGVNTMEDAEKLRNLELYAKKEDLPKLKNGEYYFFELIGLEVILPDGSLFGKVTDVIENNASNLLEITAENGKKYLVPNIKAFVSKTDTKEGKIYITPIKGLIDDEI